ncbi:MAG: tetratricopeptide repeat protein [Acidobacteriota bacterium]
MSAFLLLAALWTASISPSPAPAPATASPAPAPGERDSRRLYLRARGAVADGQYREALELYRQVIQRMPEDAVVRYEYAQLLRDLNVQEEAVRQAREVVRLDPKMPEGHRLLGMLELATAEKDPARLDRGIEELRSARRLAPDDMATTATLARALLARGRPGEAAALLDEMPETRTQPALLRMAAEARSKSGRSREAAALYERLLESAPTDREIAAALVDVYEDDDRYDDALKLLGSMKEKDGENQAVEERITLDLARAGRFDEAEKRARDLATSRPENRDIRRLLAQVLFEKGDVTGGEKILRDLLQTDAADEMSRRALAGELLRERRFDEARVLFDDSLKRAGADPKLAEQRLWATRELAYASYLRKDYAAAKKALEPVSISGRAVDARAMRLLLAVARDSEDFAGGLARARAALAAEPSNAEWESAVAEFQYRSGDRAGATATFAKMAGSSELQRVMAAADAEARLKDYSGAAKLAREAAQRFPDSTEVQFRLASSLERAGTSAEAEKIFLQLLDAKPNDAATQNYLGYMWADKGVHLEKARDMLEKAVAREPRNGAYRDSLGWAYFRLGNYAAAERNLQEAQRRDPDDATIAEHLGDLAERQGRIEEAVRYWERSLTLKPEEPEKIRAKLNNARPRLTGKG